MLKMIKLKKVADIVIPSEKEKIKNGGNPYKSRVFAVSIC